MTPNIIHTSRPDKWSSPRPHSDPSIRRKKHGRIQPMARPGLLERLFGSR